MTTPQEPIGSGFGTNTTAANGRSPGVDIVVEGFDAGLLTESVPVAVPLEGVDELAVVATPEYLPRRGVPRTPPELLNHECIRNTLLSGMVYRWEFERHGEVIQIDPPGRLTLSGWRLGLRAARAGMGVACVTERSAREAVAGRRPIRLLPEWTEVCLYAIALAEALLVHAGQTSGTPDTSFSDVFEIARARLDKFREGQVTGVTRPTLSSLPLLYANRRTDA
jgi:DNA-binding transcriptional LysR family regulator